MGFVHSHAKSFILFTPFGGQNFELVIKYPGILWKDGTFILIGEKD